MSTAEPKPLLRTDFERRGGQREQAMPPVRHFTATMRVVWLALQACAVLAEVQINFPNLATNTQHRTVTQDWVEPATATPPLDHYTVSVRRTLPLPAADIVTGVVLPSSATQYIFNLSAPATRHAPRAAHSVAMTHFYFRCYVCSMRCRGGPHARHDRGGRLAGGWRFDEHHSDA